MNVQTWLAGWMLALSLSLAGCGQYVNIPNDPGDIAASSPNLLNVQQTAVRAVAAVLEDRPLGRPYRLILPVGADDGSYAYAMRELGTMHRGLINRPWPICLSLKSAMCASAAGWHRWM
ncbi:MAG: hypothetical protein HC898_01485 [Phycisphaerales bacterium]|nr:hypothetical protein [Phycisphaerales bacterium]